MATLVPTTFDRTFTVSVEGADCPTCAALVTGVEIVGAFAVAEDASVPGPAGVVCVAVSMREVRGFRFLPCGCPRPVVLSSEAP